MLLKHSSKTFFYKKRLFFLKKNAIQTLWVNFVRIIQFLAKYLSTAQIFLFLVILAFTNTEMESDIIFLSKPKVPRDAHILFKYLECYLNCVSEMKKNLVKTFKTIEKESDFSSFCW